MPLSDRDIRRLFELLNAALRDEGIEGELFVVGGAVIPLDRFPQKTLYALAELLPP